MKGEDEPCALTAVFFSCAWRFLLPLCKQDRADGDAADAPREAVRRGGDGRPGSGALAAARLPTASQPCCCCCVTTQQTDCFRGVCLCVPCRCALHALAE